MTDTNVTTAQKAGTVAGRFFFTLIFIMSGLGKIADWQGTTAYMSAAGMPMVDLFLGGAIVLEVVGGLSILLGYRARWGALLLIVFLVPATFIFHAFWTLPAEAQQMQMILFMKNISMLGALIFITINGAGPASLDRRAGRA